MFCPSCGTSNPEAGRFCRSCGSTLAAIAAPAQQPPQQTQQQLLNQKGKPIHLEGAMTKMFMGVAFALITIALVTTGAGRGWWFWMLIPTFTMFGTGLAQYLRIRQFEKGQPVYSPTPAMPPRDTQEALPPAQTSFIAPAQSRYQTGDLVPPSVTEGTTRHLATDSEGQTMTLPKKED